MLSFSQTTWKPKMINDSLIVITSSQLKQTNLIFLEHKKLKLTVSELSNQVSNYQLLYNNSLKKDSLYNQSISNMIVEIQQKDLQIQDQAVKINKQKTAIRYISIGGAVAVLLCILNKCQL